VISSKERAGALCGPGDLAELRQAAGLEEDADA